MSTAPTANALPEHFPAERIVIVEDHELLADSLAYALSRNGFDSR